MAKPFTVSIVLILAAQFFLGFSGKITITVALAITLLMIAILYPLSKIYDLLKDKKGS